jgi:hypothetical protein
MARPRLPIEETLRYEIYCEYCRHAERTNTLPNPHVFYEQILTQLGYSIKWSTFRDHWRELQLDGLIRTDKRTGAVEIVRGDVITPLENS